MREYGVHCARLFVRLRLRANGAYHNVNVTRRSHYQKSLLRDNDRAVFRAKLVIIYVDWIALLRRLLMHYNFPVEDLPEAFNRAFNTGIISKIQRHD